MAASACGSSGGTLPIIPVFARRSAFRLRASASISFVLARRIGIFADVREYERNLAELVSSTKPAVKGLVLMTPYYIEPNRQDAMRATMDRYGAVVKKIAGATPGTVLVDTQAAFDRLLTTYYPATINWDRVHPNPTGSALIARAFLTAIGFDWQRGLEGV